MNVADAVAGFAESSPAGTRIDTDDTGDGWTVISDEPLGELLERLESAGIPIAEYGEEQPDYAVGLWECSWAWIDNNAVIERKEQPMTDKTMSNVLFSQTERLQRPDGNNGAIVGAEIRVRLMRVEIDGVIRLYRRLCAYPVAGYTYDLHEGNPIHDDETLLPPHTQESTAIRCAIEDFDALVHQCRKDSNTFSPVDVVEDSGEISF